MLDGDREDVDEVKDGTVDRDELGLCPGFEDRVVEKEEQDAGDPSLINPAAGSSDRRLVLLVLPSFSPSSADAGRRSR